MTVDGTVEGNKDRAPDGRKLGGMKILGDSDKRALGYSLPSQQCSPG